MWKVCRAIASSSFAFAVTLSLAGGAAAQETPMPVPVPETEAPVPETEADAPLAETQDPIVVELGAVGGAEGSGEATLRTGMGDQTEAVLEVEGLAPGTQWSAFLIAGTCDQPGDTISPLGTIEVADQGSGRGEASVTTALSELTASPATVQVHPQAETPTQAVLCGAVAADGPSLPAF